MEIIEQVTGVVRVTSMDPLEALLASQECWQSVEVLNDQNAAVLKLGEVVRRWEQRVASCKGFVDKSEKACQLLCIGSHKLGVPLKGSDIDLLCVAPNWLHRHDFNTSLLELIQVTEGVGQIRPVPHASVPVLKFNLDGVDIDLLFARLEQEEIEEELSLIHISEAHETDS